MTTVSPASVRVLSVEGTRVRVSVRGAGRPLLLVMGIGASLDMWGPLEEQLVPRGYHLIAFDLPGAGASPALLPPRRMGGLARIAVGILDELGFERTDVLGVSFGGAIAQQIVHQAPSRVNRLVLAATAPGLGGLPGNPRVLRHMVTPRRYTSPDYTARIAGDLYGGRARLSPDLHALMPARFLRPPSLYGYATQLYTIAGWTSLPWLHRVKTRTLILNGDDDPIVPLINGRIMAVLLPNGKLHVIEGGGHLFLLEHSAEAAELVDDFLTQP